MRARARDDRQREHRRLSEPRAARPGRRHPSRAARPRTRRCGRCRASQPPRPAPPPARRTARRAEAITRTSSGAPEPAARESAAGQFGVRRSSSTSTASGFCPRSAGAGSGAVAAPSAEFEHGAAHRESHEIGVRARAGCRDLAHIDLHALPHTLAGGDRVRERDRERAAVRLVRGVRPVALVFHLEHVAVERDRHLRPGVQPRQLRDVEHRLIGADRAREATPPRSCRRCASPAAPRPRAGADAAPRVPCGSWRTRAPTPGRRSPRDGCRGPRCGRPRGSSSRAPPSARAA